METVGYSLFAGPLVWEYLFLGRKEFLSLLTKVMIMAIIPLSYI